MPPRSSRNHNARKHSAALITNTNVDEIEQPQPSSQRRASPSLPFSPPTQLPTPLPEEHIPVAPATLDLLNFAAGASGGDSNATLSHLIDFDTPTPPPQPFAPLPNDSQNGMASSLLSEGDDDAVYRSPPFREAHLQDGSPPPLPIPPRYHQRYVDDSDAGLDGQGQGPGHTRTPTFVRSTISASSSSNAHIRYPSSSSISPGASSTFDTLSRTIRGYVPTAAPSAPRVSRPVSYAFFSGSPNVSAADQAQGQDQHRLSGRAPGNASRQEFEREYEREDAEADAEGAYYGYGGYPSSPPPPHPAALALAQEREAYAGQHVQARQHQNQLQQGHGHQRYHSASGRFMGSGLAQVIRRGAAAGAGVVGARGVQRVAGGPSTHSKAGESGRRGVDDRVLWARWDFLNGRRVLIIAYPSGLQMWDCADLGALREVFNLNLGAAEWALMLGGAGTGQNVRVVHAAVLPWNEGMEKDTLREARPLLGMLLESADEDEREHEPQSVFVVYSLRTHQVAKMRPMPGLASTFIANENFIVIGTTTPPNLHILSSTTFHTLHIITSAHLEPYSTPSSSHTTPSAISITNAISNTAQSTSVSLGLSIDTNTTNNTKTNASGSGKASPEVPPEAPHPVFALSHRLLAYASPSAVYSPPQLAAAGSSSSSVSKATRRLSSSSAGSAPSNASSSLSSSPFGVGLGKITNMTQADVGHAALKVGESVFSGMKFLGGMALEAAKSRVGAVGPEGRIGPFGIAGAGTGTGGRVGAAADAGMSGSPGGARFVSRSAPDSSGVGEGALRGRSHSNTSNLSTWDQRGAGGGSTPNSPSPHLTTVAPSTRSTSESGHYVTVVDLAPLLRGGGAAPAKIDEFNVSRSQPVADLSFAKDGTSVAAVLRDGHAVRVFKLQPTPRVLVEARAAAVSSAAASGGLDELEMRGEVGRRAAHVYDLYRGRTSAIVEGLDWASDGRWLGVGTRNRTIHVFGVNPYGGKPDVRSHVEGRVRNVDVIEPRLAKIQPLVRLRGTKANVEQLKAPLAFTFISPADVASSPNLVFPFAPPPITNSPTFTAPKLKRGTNYQDILVFDPVDGVLSLRRLTIERQPVKDHGLGASMQALGVTSISLPGMGGAGRLSSSPSTKATESSRAGVSDPPMELVVKEGVEATWDLKRGRDWVEMKTHVEPKVQGGRKTGVPGSDWLAEGEISTCSQSTRVLPRSLYLSHQFSFYTLGEDYHALIRRHQFDIIGTKIEVRKVVEISAYTSGGGESAFVEGFSSPRDVRRVSSSFDEPIASAISGSLDSSNLPTILPMYPNGVPGSKPKSFRSSIPIRTMTGIGDGMSEGLGRIRREMHKARSPQLAPRPDSSLSGPVPLEFDEEDEDFIDRDALGVPYGHGDSSTSRETSRDGTGGTSTASLVTPLNLSTHHLMNADVVGSMEEDLWNGWDPQDKQAVEEAEQFHDLTDLVAVEEDRSHGRIVPAPQLKPSSKREGRSKRRG